MSAVRQSVFQGHIMGVRAALGTTRLTAQTQANLLQKVSSAKSPKPPKRMQLSPLEPQQKQTDQKTRQLDVRLSGKSCLLTTMFVRHYLPKERTH